MAGKSGPLHGKLPHMAVTSHVIEGFWNVELQAPKPFQHLLRCAISMFFASVFPTLPLGFHSDMLNQALRDVFSLLAVGTSKVSWRHLPFLLELDFYFNEEQMDACVSKRPLEAFGSV